VRCEERYVPVTAFSDSGDHVWRGAGDDEVKQPLRCGATKVVS
jgi:hypothetical protein